VWHVKAPARHLIRRSTAVAASMEPPIHVNPLHIHNISKVLAPVRIAMLTMMPHRHSPAPMRVIPSPSAPVPQGMNARSVNYEIDIY
jgi:hypothetical protein